MNQSAPSASPTIVLVHGGFADASSWNGVIDRLQVAGLTTIAPANPLRGVMQDSAYVSNVVKTIEGPVLLVGHSYGGLVITNVGSQVENAVGLVYVAAMAPAEGEAMLDVAFATRPLAEWRQLFDAAGLTYGVVQTFEEVAHDPQFAADQVLVPVDDGSAQPRLTIDSPVRLDQEQKVRPRPAPELGEHSEAVLQDLGFDAAAIASLRADGTITQK
jgi:pimeloyl-ACP methyl ester carboxylesterase